ncbi:hypothetical protein MOQ72_43575 [Saccharopolyspora sp. K220]|uniref:hypothetical protein n=1 Tax=Saccharopolyspora soli TaxID=2926618 RepID=UPI001F57EAD3|nr:hypothetical protein [Saccharopolyspora soli]MCI2424295.1 hypothetical protein [Saccharopolyspora soli]
MREDAGLDPALCWRPSSATGPTGEYSRSLRAWPTDPPVEPDRAGVQRLLEAVLLAGNAERFYTITPAPTVTR